MTVRSRARRLFGIAVVAALVATGGLVTTATAEDGRASSNPGQADGPGIITVEQTNMCMWGSALDCFDNPYDEGEDGWEDAERATAQQKRDSLITQYRRHQPDVITVNEGCLTDLQAVADELGYELRYEDTGDGTDGIPRYCTVDRGPGINAILAKKFTGDGPKGYFEDQGYRSYVCAQVSTEEWDSVRVCTAHLSLGTQDDHRETECKILRDDILDPSEGFVIFAGDVNMKGAGKNCAPADFHGLKDLERNPDDNTTTSGLQHIYYSANGFWRQSCGWSYDVDHTDHPGFLLELGKEAPADDPGDCWRDIR